MWQKEQRADYRTTNTWVGTAFQSGIDCSIVVTVALPYAYIVIAYSLANLLEVSGVIASLSPWSVCIFLNRDLFIMNKLQSRLDENRHPDIYTSVVTHLAVYFYTHSFWVSTGKVHLLVIIVSIPNAYKENMCSPIAFTKTDLCAFITWQTTCDIYGG